MTPVDGDGPWKEILAVLGGVATAIATAFGLWVKQSKDRLAVKKTEGEGSWIETLQARDRDAAQQASIREREAIASAKLAQEQHLEDVQAIADLKAENRELKHRMSQMELELKLLKRMLSKSNPAEAAMMWPAEFGDLK